MAEDIFLRYEGRMINIARAPKWAQAEMRAMAARIAELTGAIAERDGTVGETDTVVEESSRLPNRPLPKGSRIGFDLDGGESLRDLMVYVDRSGNRPALRVMSRYGRGLNVRPESGNVVTITVRGYTE